MTEKILSTLPRYAQQLAALLPRTLQLLVRLADFPWRSTFEVLRARFREDRLGMTAGSLTFTSFTALVPLVTVALAIFSAFPMFAKLQQGLQSWMQQSLFPPAIANHVMHYITQFSSKASGLGLASSAFLLFTAIALTLTVDTALNKIWRVQRKRPFTQRVVVYWAAITLGPLLLAGFISLTSYAFTLSKNTQGMGFIKSEGIIRLVQFWLVVAASTLLYRFVPNTVVRWAHAFAGGLFVAIGIELARRLLGLYVKGMGSVSTIYGALATLPILLMWMYMLWAIVLLGAVIAAYLPSILTGVGRKDDRDGWRFALALDVLQSLKAVQHTTTRGMTMQQLSRKHHASSVQLEPIVDTLLKLDWVGQLNEERAEQYGQARYVLLVNLQSTPLAPLLEALLLPENSPSLHQFQRHVDTLNLQVNDVLVTAAAHTRSGTAHS